MLEDAFSQSLSYFGVFLRRLVKTVGHYRHKQFLVWSISEIPPHLKIVIWQSLSYQNLLLARHTNEHDVSTITKPYINQEIKWSCSKCLLCPLCINGVSLWSWKRNFTCCTSNTLFAFHLSDKSDKLCPLLPVNIARRHKRNLPHIYWIRLKLLKAFMPSFAIQTACHVGMTHIGILSSIYFQKSTTFSSSREFTWGETLFSICLCNNIQQYIAPWTSVGIVREYRSIQYTELWQYTFGGNVKHCMMSPIY